MSTLQVSRPVSWISYAEEIDAALDKYADNPMFSMGDMKIPRLSDMTAMEVQMSGNGDSDYEMPADVLEKIQNSDVTTITDNTVYLMQRMFAEMTPTILGNITSGIDAGIEGINKGLEAMGGMGTMDTMPGAESQMPAMGEMPADMGEQGDMPDPGAMTGEMPSGMGAMTGVVTEGRRHPPGKNTIRGI